MALPLPASPVPRAPTRPLPPLPPRWTQAAARLPERPDFSQFIFLSMLLHALFIVLFGAPSGGSREGRAMWGTIEAKLVGPFRETRAFSAVDLPPPRPAPIPEPPPALPAPPVEAAPPPIVESPRPPARARAQARFPRVIDKIIQRKADTRPVDKVPPPTELAPAPVSPPSPPEDLKAPEPVKAEPPREEPEPPRTEPLKAEPIKVPEPIKPIESLKLPEPVKAPDLVAPVETPIVPTAPTPPVAAPPIEVKTLPVPKPVELPRPIEAPKLLEPAPLPVETPAPKPPTALERALQQPREPTIEERKAPPKATAPATPAPAAPTAAPATPKAEGRGPSDKAFPEGRGDTGYDPTAPGPGLDLDAIRRRAGQMAREGSGQRALLPFPMPPIPPKKSKVEQAIENARKPDCATAYKDMGLLAVVPLVANEFGEGNCKW
jgi:hypothetical protein